MSTKTNTDLANLFHRLAVLRQEQRHRRDILTAAEVRTERVQARKREGKSMAEWKPRSPSAKAVPSKDETGGAGERR
jgi:hypothetical protein